MPGGLSMAGAVVTVALVLLLAYWCSRLLGKGWMKASSGRNMKVLEQLQLGPDKRILLLKLKDRHYLVGVSQAGIQLLTEVDGEFGDPEMEQSGLEPYRFSEYMKKYTDLHRRKREENDE